MKRTLVLVIALLLLLSACASPGSDLRGTTWELSSWGTLDVEVPALAGIETRLEFGSDGTVSGSLGCNLISGTYKVRKGVIVFGPLAATEMACPEDQMAQEAAAFQVLSGSVSYQFVEGVLILRNSGGNGLVLVRK